MKKIQILYQTSTNQQSQDKAQNNYFSNQVCFINWHFVFCHHFSKDFIKIRKNNMKMLSILKPFQMILITQLNPVVVCVANLSQFSITYFSETLLQITDKPHLFPNSINNLTNFQLLRFSAVFGIIFSIFFQLSYLSENNQFVPFIQKLLILLINNIAVISNSSMKAQLNTQNGSPLFSIKCSNGSSYAHKISQKKSKFQSPSQATNTPLTPTFCNAENDNYQLIADSENKKLRLYNIKLNQTEYDSAMKQYQLRQVNKNPHCILKILYAGCSQNTNENVKNSSANLSLTVITEHVSFTLNNNQQKIIQRLYPNFPSFLIYLVQILRAYEQMSKVFGSVAISPDHFGFTQCGKMKIYYNKNLAMFKPDTILFNKQNRIITEIGYMLTNAFGANSSIQKQCLNFLEKFLAFCDQQNEILTFKGARNFIQSFPSISLSNLACNSSFAPWLNPLIQNIPSQQSNSHLFNNFCSPPCKANQKKQNSQSHQKPKTSRKGDKKIPFMHSITASNSKTNLLSNCQRLSQPLSQIVNFMNNQQKKMNSPPPISNRRKQENRMINSVKEATCLISPISGIGSNKKNVYPLGFNHNYTRTTLFENISQKVQTKNTQNINFPITIVPTPINQKKNLKNHKKMGIKHNKENIKKGGGMYSQSRYPSQLHCEQSIDNRTYRYRNSNDQQVPLYIKKEQQIIVGQFCVSQQSKENDQGLKQITNQSINIIQDVIAKKMLKKQGLAKQQQKIVCNKKQKSNFVPYQIIKNKSVVPDVPAKKTIDNYQINNQFNIIIHDSFNSTVKNSQAKNSMASTSYNTCKLFPIDDNMPTKMTDSIMISRDLQPNDRTKTMRSLGRFQNRDRNFIMEQRYGSPKLCLQKEQMRKRRGNGRNLHIKQNKNSLISGQIKSIIPPAFRKVQTKVFQKNDNKNLFWNFINQEDTQPSGCNSLKSAKDQNVSLLEKLRTMSITESSYFQVEMSPEKQEIIKQMIKANFNINSSQSIQTSSRLQKKEHQLQILSSNNWMKKITKLINNEQQTQGSLQMSLKRSILEQDCSSQKKVVIDNSFPNFKNMKIKVVQSLCDKQEFHK